MKGALSPALDSSSCLLSAVCHAGLVVPTPPILELPSLPFFLLLPSPTPLRFLHPQTRSTFYTHTNTHIHMLLSPPLSFPHHWAPASQLGDRFQHAACFSVPHFPFLVVTLLKGPSPSLYLWGSWQLLLLLIITGESETNRSSNTNNNVCPQGLGDSVWPASQGCLCPGIQQAALLGGILVGLGSDFSPLTRTLLH